MNPSLENPEKDCPFCAIARGEDASVEVISEADSWLAFFPTAPATPGHTLVIPRKHVRDLWAADLHLAEELTGAAVRVGRAIKAAVEPEGINLITSAGEAAEQTVFHLHLHLVPRWANDRLDIWPPRRSMAPQLKANLADAVRMACEEE
jgi:diadenosine tetraphosphate (Ap4A) HIT family hydrolase